MTKLRKLKIPKNRNQSLKKSITKCTEKQHQLSENSFFYCLKYDFDDLPLDPLRTFIVEKIREWLEIVHQVDCIHFDFIFDFDWIEKNRSSRPNEFVNDLDLYYAIENDRLHSNENEVENGSSGIIKSE